MKKHFKLLRLAEKDLESFVKNRIKPLSFFEKIFFCRKPYQSVAVGFVYGAGPNKSLKALVSRDTGHVYFLYTEGFDSSHEICVDIYEYDESVKKITKCEEIIKKNIFFNGKTLNQ